VNLPPDHPDRLALNDEVHARPPDPLIAPSRLSYLAMLSEWKQADAELLHVGDLAARFGAPPPEPGATHYSASMGGFRLKWERHTEFARYTVAVDGVSDDPFSETAIGELPSDWVSAIPGQVMVATHVALSPAGDGRPDYESIAKRLFTGNALIGGEVAGGAAIAVTDFRIHAGGFGRLLVRDRGLTPRQAGRTVQRLLEIDTYRIMALLALPVARRLTPFLTERERELADVTALLARDADVDEAALFERLTRLEAQIESCQSDSDYRFGAAAAYYGLVQQRIAELRELRIQGLQTLQEFTQRRLSPAMNTCKAVAGRQESLSSRVARATQMLSTRVDLARERQNQAVLESMNRRAKLQLRLQETVEGLSVAAITYYVVGLVGYAAKALAAVGVPLRADLVMGVSIPVVAVAIALGLRKIRKTVARAAEP
jgi:uncharacterized membrane-anchored protein